ncbi:hypothetical protein FD755_016278 [Muntiacus reevesi]|uniref:Coiled-coil domain-containing protein 86 n=1 Tax=Muntiacus reevesi TaxID=9886 RepID=A0A5N3XGW5_MUNRE|nr:hypothetical protein FD755_016278 [Muntiacus reevesi]
MATPLRRSLRLEDVKTESPENPTSVLQARWALVEFQSNPEEMSEPSPQSETRPGSPSSPQGQRDPGLESPQSQQKSSPEFHRLQSKPNEESPKFSQDQGEAASELCKSKEEPTPRSPNITSLGPKPSKPLQKLTPQSPGSPRDQHEEGLAPKKRKSCRAQAPESKKPKEEETPIIPKGKRKSGRVEGPLKEERKMKDRQERKLAKDFSRHLEEEKERRRRENLKRCLEEEREAEIVQVIRNPAKLKRAKKQQLRSIEKPDTLTQLQKPPPQRPAAKV